jgi:hypothetical protein
MKIESRLRALNALFFRFAISASCVGLVGVGCSGSDSAGGPSYGGSAGSGNSSSGGSGGSGAGGAGGSNAQCDQPVLDINQYPVCSFCPGGRCIPKSAIPGAVTDELADCDPESKCVPDHLAATGGNFRLQPCRSVANTEGRCGPLCIPQVAKEQAFLVQGSCPTNHLCAPCFDPRTGTDTGACSRGCGDKPVEPPVTFAACCNGRGMCVPEQAVPENSRSSLGTESCEQKGEKYLCAPVEKVQDFAFKYPACTAGTFGAGACLPACIVDANPNGALLTRADCVKPDDKCVPCVNPLDQTRTGACD